jgi:hypothetical protein
MGEIDRILTSLMEILYLFEFDCVSARASARAVDPEICRI